MTWFLDEQPFNDPDETDVGFVYEITEKNTDKKYIGKKLFWKTVRRKPRGTKRIRLVKVPSDWKDYYGSSNDLKDRLKEYGKDNFNREILHICKSKGMLSYMEIKEQINRDVLFREDYYNGIINCRINEKHLK